MRRGYDVMGVAMVDQPFASALGSLSAALKGPRGQTAFFANAATLNLASTDPDYRQALNAASFMYGDGTGVRWAARARGTRLQANLNGTDLIPELIRMNPGVRVYLLGGDQDLAVAAARRFPKLFPEAVLAGWHNGYFDRILRRCLMKSMPPNPISCWSVSAIRCRRVGACVFAAS